MIHPRVQSRYNKDGAAICTMSSLPLTQIEYTKQYYTSATIKEASNKHRGQMWYYCALYRNGSCIFARFIPLLSAVTRRSEFTKKYPSKKENYFNYSRTIKYVLR